MEKLEIFVIEPAVLKADSPKDSASASCGSTNYSSVACKVPKPEFAGFCIIPDPK